MFFAILINRLCKIFGALLKGLSYIIYFIFPKLRFTIPKVSKAKISSKKSSLVPKIIWQTNYSNVVTLPIYINYLFNRLMSLDWEYRYVSTEDRLEYIKQNAPKNYIYAFEQLTDGAAQADFWRLFVLNNIGGVYMDIDAHIVLPLSKLIKPEDKELFIKSKVRYNNYFLATAPNNKHFKNTLDLIVDNIENRRVEGGVYSLTGPMALNQAIGDQAINYKLYKYVCIQGSFTNEYFQYMDKPRGKWTHAKKENLLKKVD
ncbi:glycosyl transferase [Aliarcobacter skirrowii]|uniref:glycosyltransferase family 32 protein n=1 Tax=Aliarcobacter skirrowii TaxID=28200 RepID=UPI00100B025B|nr:glycosyltransferase [Aliarcobacter skirrowii]RXJ78327.1 glycosyl transferase [Aliarcobacter skirrowii]